MSFLQKIILIEAQSQQIHKKALKIYYKEQLQTIHYYPGTTQAELESTLRSLFNIQKDTNLIFLDENGIPLVLSSSLPSNLQLSLQVKTLVSEQQQKINNNIAKKLQQENKSTISESGKLEFQIAYSCLKYRPTLQDFQKKVSSFQVDAEITDLRVQLKIVKNKKYYFQYSFETLTCCMSAYLFIHLEHQHQGERGNISMGFGCEKTNKLNNVIVGIAIDTIKNKWYIVNPTTKKSVKSYEINPDWQYPQMALWTKHGEAVCVISDLMEYPSYL